MKPSHYLNVLKYYLHFLQQFLHVAFPCHRDHVWTDPKKMCFGNVSVHSHA